MTDHQHYLACCVLKTWDDAHIRPINDTTATKLATAAVAEVIDALQANPAWAESLGINVT